MDPERFTPDFEPRLAQYLERMRQLDGDNGPVLVAGDPEKEFAQNANQQGVLLHAAVATTLKALATKHGVLVPAELQGLDESKSKASMYA